MSLMFCNIFFHKNNVGENDPLSLLLKEKSGSAKSDVSKMLLPEIGKITNLLERSGDKNRWKDFAIASCQLQGNCK